MIKKASGTSFKLISVVLLLTVIYLASCTHHSSTTHGLRFEDEPFVTIETHTEEDNRLTASGEPNTVITGFSLHVSGKLPDGTPYDYQGFSIKGAGLQGITRPPCGLQQFTYPYMDFLADKSGANCVRCYGAAFDQFNSPEEQANDVKAALEWADNATRKGSPMFVAVGITMGRASVINYADSSANSLKMQQRAKIQEFVDKVIALDNSRQLLWVIGNELVDVTSAKTDVYKEIDTIAQYIKRKGSHLPCMTAVQTVGTDELKIIAANCPNIDILGINTYFGSFGTLKGGGYLNQLPTTMATSRNQEGGWKKPYIVSEFGSYDLCGENLPKVELPDTPPYTLKQYYGLEANSTLLAQDYLDNYNTYIKPYLGGKGCIGSFCYVWQNPVFSGHHAYFFEMFISGPEETPEYNPPGYLRLEAAGKMVQAWEGTKTDTKYPKIVLKDDDPQGIVCTFKSTKDHLLPDPVSPGQDLEASVTAEFKEPLHFLWYYTEDTVAHYNPQMYMNTKDNRIEGTSHITTEGDNQTDTITFKAPTTPGHYQLRVIVTPGTDKSTVYPAATASIFFRVK